MRKSVKRTIISILLIIIVAIGFVAVRAYIAIQKTISDDPTVWESSIVDFEELDQEKLPPKAGILFIGSSTFNFWDSLEKELG